jgi:RNA polymerase sigma-70 factor (ECF subfamily)
VTDVSGEPGGDADVERFLGARGLLFAVAYRMLGSVADAEDVVQDAWLAWSRTGRDDVREPEAYLTRTVTNLALRRLTSARARREVYVGPWLPEPLLTGPDVADDVVADAALAESLSMAMLVVLESLSPLERVVFVLREVFGHPHAEIARILGRSEASVRQVAHRAREHVEARRPRYGVDEDQRRAVVERFRDACEGGDLGAVLAVLSPGVTLWSDGGGRVTAARRPLSGADHVARWMLGVLAKPVVRGVRLEPAVVNGEPGLVVVHEGRRSGALSLDVADGRVTALRFQLNPEKLRGLEHPAGGPPARGGPIG